MSNFLLKLARLLVLLAIPRQTRRNLPVALDQIDAQVPALLAKRAPSAALYAITAQALHAASGDHPSPVAVAATRMLWDYIEAAKK